ncbi:MAG: hypothetical protein Q8927_12130 [Bacteroidota bacterium]|jgi:hypothetical protein|nr:hypothetical protein [Bacteroidota bacterium]MDP4216940.1 hypothetical protein [Bacteroidota bacterium]MDP4245762.1 hypothetical protein [Bacteroidota bacterium]MDP4253581.1 hypothetical protein [Bacteroidota bacterium]MDP4257094.1 hypothetical protein [Bacteroidota bacterium]
MTIEVSVYPNPFVNSISIEVICEEEKNCIILLADIQNERIIRMMGAGLGKGLNKIPLQNLQALQLGAYQLDIKDPEGDTLYKTKLIKQ